MSIKYLCSSCCDALRIKSNEIGINEVGRKNCWACGDNSDWCMHVLDEEECHAAVYRARKEGWIKWHTHT